MLAMDLVAACREASRDGQAEAVEQVEHVTDDARIATLVRPGHTREPPAGEGDTAKAGVPGRARAPVAVGRGQHLCHVPGRMVVGEDRTAVVTWCAGALQIPAGRRNRVGGVVDAEAPAPVAIGAKRVPGVASIAAAVVARTDAELHRARRSVAVDSRVDAGQA